SKVSGFALMVVLAGLSLSEIAPAGAPRLSVAAGGILLASYARPELYPAALCLCLAAVWLAYRGTRGSGRHILLWPAAGLACLVMLALGAGTPLLSASQKSDRLLWAFREHFAWNWGRWHHEWRDIFSVWEHEFGGAQSTLQAFATNPQAVLHHLSDNLLGTMRFVAVTTFDHYPVLVPATSPLLVKAESALLSLVAFGSLIVVASRPHLRRQMQERYGHALFVYVLLAIGSLASATVVFPLAYYLVIPGALLVLTGTLAASLLIPARRQFST